MKRSDLLKILDNLLQPWKVRDYCPNGLQVEGTDSIKSIVTGVTASQALIEQAIEKKADAILVHHGYFWKGESAPVTGMKKQRLQRLLAHDINLFAYHLPIDVHPQLGNNAQLAKLLNIQNTRTLDETDFGCVVMTGELETASSTSDFAATIEQKLERQPMVCQVNDKPVKTVAWCSGGGQGYIDQAAARGIDLFFTGEVSEQTIHSAREQDINFIAAGHHATERYGVKAVGEWLSREHGVSTQFIDIPNPA